MGKRYSLNVVGPFYVEDGCCTSCGVPQVFAPALFAENGQEHCYVRRQPETEAETDAMVRAIANQELGCIRYAGSDPAILRRLVEAGEGHQCDGPLPSGVVPLRRDHVRFATPWTAREILERMITSNASWRTTAVHEVSASAASVSISWFEDDYHRIEAFASGGDGCIRHHGPPRLADSIHDWLVGEPTVTSCRWQTREQFEKDGAWSKTPW